MCNETKKPRDERNITEVIDAAIHTHGLDAVQSVLSITSRFDMDPVTGEMVETPKGQFIDYTKLLDRLEAL